MRTPSIYRKPSCRRNQAPRVLQCSGAKLRHIGSLVNFSGVRDIMASRITAGRDKGYTPRSNE